MVLFPWIVLVLVTLAVAVGLLAAAGVVWTRRWRRGRVEPAPFAIGVASTLVVAIPLLLAILAWGLVIKPR